MSKDQSSSDIDLVLCLKRWRIPKVSKGNTCLQMQKHQVLQWRRLVIASLTFVMLSLQIFQPVGDYISGKGAIETSGAKHCTNKKKQCLIWSRGVLSKVQEEQLRGRMCRSKVNNDFHVLMVFLWLAVLVLFLWIHVRKRGVYLKDKGSVC